MDEYRMEEMIPIVSELIKKYTSNESTSVTYEKAQQLMGAVMYCIQEFEQGGDEKTRSVRLNMVSAREAYQKGYEQVIRKVKETIEKYNRMIIWFDSYENQCLYDTVIKGIPEFFKWYDPRFAPQDTILTLDYPIMDDLTRLQGIDRIFEYLNYIYFEQISLAKMEREEVIQRLEEYHCEYRELIENLSEMLAIRPAGGQKPT